MTALTRWNPFEQMEAMQDRLFSTFDLSPDRSGTESSTEMEWAPLCDVIETANGFIIRADMPGVNKQDLSVTLENGDLLINAKRAAEQFPEGAEYLDSEVPYGVFSRAIALPASADPAQINASYNNGVLTVHVAKHENAKPRVITVSSGEGK